MPGMGGPVTFLLFRRLVDLIRVGPTPDEKDVEIAVLRYQPVVLHRHVARLGGRHHQAGAPPQVRACLCRAQPSFSLRTNS
jgi:hypothetical protein